MGSPSQKQEGVWTRGQEAADQKYLSLQLPDPRGTAEAHHLPTSRASYTDGHFKDHQERRQKTLDEWLNDAKEGFIIIITGNIV